MRVRSPSSTARRIASLTPWLLSFGALACGPDETVEPDDRVSVKLSFDQTTYVDAAISPHRMLERIKNQARSILPALRKADVMVLGNAQMDIEPAKLRREPTIIVDPATGVTRAALRVRFHYVALAQVPRALADKGDLALGELHGRDGSRAEAVLAACTANGENERQAVAELWTVFDPALPSCAEAMRHEQADIDVARKKLAHPDREVVSAEFERVYLPMVVHVKRRQPAVTTGETAPPGKAEPVTIGETAPPGKAPPATTGATAPPGKAPPATIGEPVPPSKAQPAAAWGSALLAPSAGTYTTPKPPAEGSMPAAVPGSSPNAIRPARAGAPWGIGAPVPSAADDEPHTAVYVEKDDDPDVEDDADEAELRRQARMLYGDQGPVAAPTSYGSSPYLQPNFAVLYLAIVAFLVLLAGKRRRRSRSR